MAASQNGLAMLSDYGSQHAESPRYHEGDLRADQALPSSGVEPLAAAKATEVALTSPASPTEDAAPAVVSAEVVSAPGAEDGIASRPTTGAEVVRQNEQVGLQQRAEPEEAGGAGEPEQAGPIQGTPPGDVQAIMAKLVGFVKVRPAPVIRPMIRPMMRQVRPVGLRACG